jgi:16S rRNA (uracil1498-N3)-methyltransferase
MRVFLLPGEALSGEVASGELSGTRRVRIVGKDFHYLARVLRLGVGDRFRGTDGGARLWDCRISRLEQDSLEAVLEEPAKATPPPHRITLLQGLPKGRKMDRIIRQATEAGVSRVIPLLCRNSLYRFDGERDVGNKLRRWRTIAREALQQSGAPEMPAIEEPRTLLDALEGVDGEAAAGQVRLVFHTQRREGRSLHECLAGGVRSVLLVIGPEGGLSDGELDVLVSRGFTPVTLGATVLRTETAAVFAVAAIQAIVQEREAWQPAP